MRALFLASLFVGPLVLAPFAALSARAEDGAPSASPRVPTTVLRHVDTATASAPPEPAKKELVILVGGYQSCPCDGTFDALSRRLIDAGFEVREFGVDRAFPYDSYGPIDVSARNLRDEVRSLAPRYAGVHLVTHSMGGVVADRAFAQGLSAEDGVLTYVSWSGPHSGSDAAVAASAVRFATGGDGGLLRESLLWLGWEAASPAARDLASTRPIPPPRGVVRLDLRESNDVVVTGRDARDPGVVSRVLQGHTIEGHGAILNDPDAIDATVATIASRAVPPDYRAQRLIASAEQSSRRWTAGALVLLCVCAAAVCVGAFMLRDRIHPIADIAARILPRGARRRCV